MTTYLPSFQFFPVRILSWGKTVLIEECRVRFQFRGLRSLFQRDRDLPVSEFECVRIAGATHIDEAYGDGSADESVSIRVRLIHGSSRFNNALLAGKTFDVDDVTEEKVEPLRKVWMNAARALSLLAADAGVRDVIRGPVKDVRSWVRTKSKA